MANDGEHKFIDIVIDEDTDMSQLPDSILYHLEAGTGPVAEAAKAETQRRAEVEVDRMIAEIEARQAAGLPDEDEE